MISLGQDWDEVALRWLGPTTGCSAHMEQPWQGVEGWAVAGSATGDTSTLWHGWYWYPESSPGQGASFSWQDRERQR